MASSADGRQEEMAARIKDFARRDFAPRFGELVADEPSNPLWKRLCELGTELWLDTGSIEDAKALWTREITALTTNNSLLNKEVQKGAYDKLIPEAAALLAPYDLGARDLVLEVAFILNAVHGLRLVEQFDAYVSVEEHTDLAHDMSRALAYARRYHEICPERFIVKLPFTAAGVLANRQLSAEGVTVNHTLGFSARQNYVIARIARPAFVNVFMGRLNSFVTDNGLGPGENVGERTTLASQAALRGLRDSGIETRQIGASLRSGEQIRDLAGLDVFTMPPAAAQGFLGLGLEPDAVVDCTGVDYPVDLNDGVDRDAIRLDTLWDVDDALVACLDALDNEDVAAFTPADLRTFFASRGCGDILVDWTEEQVRTSAEEGKIPKLENWRAALAEKAVGLDSLMNLAGLNAFRGDQAKMDERVSGALGA